MRPGLGCLELIGQLEQQLLLADPRGEVSPTGRPSAVQCSGTLMAGAPATFCTGV
jgi:hypothetical protein